MDRSKLGDHNHSIERSHAEKLDAARRLAGLDDGQFEKLIVALQALQIAIPSWALGTGGTRFGRFPAGGEPRNLEEKINDVGILHQLTRATDSISLHIPWDIPENPAHVKSLLKEQGLRIDAVNSNTFQDQSGQAYSYKFGSLCHTDERVRRQAIDHNITVVRHGEALGSRALSVWLSDGSSFPGQHHFRKAFDHTRNALAEIYSSMPADWTLLLEYKPYEPNFYSMVIPDWGTALKLAEACGSRAHVLVDLGHHLPNTNVEQIVARLLGMGRLGGFHFNGSHYGDDDLTTGSIRPYQLFLIFNEIISAAREKVKNPEIAYMIDASHNVKDPLEDLMQSLENIRISFAKAYMVDHAALSGVQSGNDVAGAERVLQKAFQTDVRPFVAEARRRAGGAIDPAGFFRSSRVREELIRARGKGAVATGL